MLFYSLLLFYYIDVNDGVSLFNTFSNAYISSNISVINESLEALANQILSIYFVSNRCIVILSEKNILQNLKIANTVSYFEIDSEREDCYLDIHYHLRKTFVDNCDGYIVQLKDPICAMKGWEETYKKRFIPRHNPKFFFLPFYPNTTCYADELMSMRITDISTNILAAEIVENDTDWSAILVTNNFYKHPSDPDREPKIYLDEWHYKTGFKKNVDLYPDRMNNLQGKVFRVATGKYLPYTTDEPLDGMENRIALQFCEKHNCTAVPVTDDYYWGTIYENLTGNGVLGNVYVDLADIGTLAVFLWLEEHYYIDYSDSYLKGEVSAMLPKPRRLGGWIIPFLPFSVDVWIAFFISLLLSATSLFFVTRVSIKYTRFREQLLKKMQFITIEDSWMRAVGLAVLQQPSSRLIGNSPNRYLFTSFEFLYLVLSAMYSAELASYLTIPLYDPPIDTFHDFAKSGIQWYGTHEAFTYSLMGSSDEDAKAVVRHFNVLPMDQLKEVAKEGIYGFTAERLPGGSITEQDHIVAEVIPMYHIMKGYLFGSPLVVSIKKGGPYNKYYNRIVNEVVEHGFSLFWEAEVARQYLDSRIQAEYNQAKTIQIDNTPAVIEMSHLQGVLYLYAIGIIIAFIVFFYEKVKVPDKRSTLSKEINKKDIQL